MNRSQTYSNALAKIDEVGVVRLRLVTAAGRQCGVATVRRSGPAALWVRVRAEPGDQRTDKTIAQQTYFVPDTGRADMFFEVLRGLAERLLLPALIEVELQQ